MSHGIIFSRRTRTGRLRNYLAGGAVVAALAVAGCSSSGSVSAGNNGTASDATASVGTATGSPIPIGVIGSYSGGLAGLLGVGKLTMQAWADSVNAAGGIQGHPVKLYIEDDQGSVSTSLTLVKSLVQQDHVVAIVGQASNGGAAVWGPYLESVGVPVVGGQNSEPGYLTNPDFFDPLGSFVAEFYAIAAVAHTDGAKFGAIYCAEAPACAQVVPFLSGLGKAPGARINLTFSSKVASSSPDFTAVCQALKSSGVQSYTMALAAAVQERVAAQCTQQGASARIVDDVVDDTFPSVKAFNGMQIVTSSFPFFDDSIPATEEFHAALKKYAPSVGSSAVPLNYIAADVWTAGKLFQAAVAASGSKTVTSASIKQGLYALKNETLGGLTAPLNFTKGKVSLNHSYFTYDIKDGQFVEPDGMKPVSVPEAPVDAVVSSLFK